MSGMQGRNEMLTPLQTQTLDAIPAAVMRNLVVDYIDDECGTSTFMLAMMHPMRDAEPLDVFDYAVQRLRKALEQRIADNAKGAG
jgi:hypothetical protein